VTHRNRQRIGRVIGPRLLRQAKQRLHHAGDLILARTPVAANGGLDLLGGVARAFKAALPRRQHHYATGVADRECRAHVLAEVQLLERNRVGLVLAQQRVHRSVDVSEAPLLRNPGTCLDHAPVERHEPPLPACNHSVARVGQAGIYAEDDHAL